MYLEVAVFICENSDHRQEPDYQKRQQQYCYPEYDVVSSDARTEVDAIVTTFCAFFTLEIGVDVVRVGLVLNIENIKIKQLTIPVSYIIIVISTDVFRF